MSKEGKKEGKRGLSSLFKKKKVKAGERNEGMSDSSSSDTVSSETVPVPSGLSTRAAGGDAPAYNTRQKISESGAPVTDRETKTKNNQQDSDNSIAGASGGPHDTPESDHAPGPAPSESQDLTSSLQGGRTLKGEGETFSGEKQAFAAQSFVLEQTEQVNEPGDTTEKSSDTVVEEITGTQQGEEQARLSGTTGQSPEEKADTPGQKRLPTEESKETPKQASTGQSSKSEQTEEASESGDSTKDGTDSVVEENTVTQQVEEPAKPEVGRSSEDKAGTLEQDRPTTEEAKETKKRASTRRSSVSEQTEEASESGGRTKDSTDWVVEEKTGAQQSQGSAKPEFRRRTVRQRSEDKAAASGEDRPTSERIKETKADNLSKSARHTSSQHKNRRDNSEDLTVEGDDDLKEAEPEETFSIVVSDLWRKAKRNWRSAFIMSLAVLGTGATGGALATVLMLVGYHRIFAPKTVELDKAPTYVLPQAELDRIKHEARTQCEAVAHNQITTLEQQYDQKFKTELEQLRSQNVGIFTRLGHTVSKTENSHRKLNSSLLLWQLNATEEIKILHNETRNLSKGREDQENRMRVLETSTANWESDFKNSKVETNRAIASLNETFQNKTREQRAAFNCYITRLRRQQKAQLEDVKSGLERHYTAVLAEKEKAFNDSLDKINKQCEAKVQAAEQRNQKHLDDVQQTVVQKLSNVDSRQDFMFTLIHQLGFMRADTWGLIVILLAGLEVVLFVFICRGGKRLGTAILARGTGAAANGEVQRPPMSSRREWLRETGARGDNTLCVVCFRRKDMDRVKVLSQQLLQAARAAARIHLEPYVLDTRVDIQRIPACKAALVFVDPDERLMILEDRRHHMGGDRRDTVQELLDSGVKVTLVIYDDPSDNTVGPDDLYNRRLSQVREHAVLKQLNQDGRVFSVKRDLRLTDRQKDEIVRQIDRTFE